MPLIDSGGWHGMPDSGPTQKSCPSEAALWWQ